MRQRQLFSLYKRHSVLKYVEGGVIYLKSEYQKQVRLEVGCWSHESNDLKDSHSRGKKFNVQKGHDVIP